MSLSRNPRAHAETMRRMAQRRIRQVARLSPGQPVRLVYESTCRWSPLNWELFLRRGPFQAIEAALVWTDDEELTTRARPHPQAGDLDAEILRVLSLDTMACQEAALYRLDRQYDLQDHLGSAPANLARLPTRRVTRGYVLDARRCNVQERGVLRGRPPDRLSFGNLERAQIG